MLQTYINTYYVTSDYLTACIVHIGTYIISAHLAVCIMWPVLGTGTCCQLVSTHVISLLIRWLHVLYISGHISLQIIWLHVLYISGHILILAHLAVCIMWPVLGTGTFCKDLYRHITFVIIWLHVMYISQHIYLYHSVWLCALCNLYWGQVHAANLYRKTYIVSLMIIWLHVM